ncbi:adenylate kinase isoenzyme 5 isoform X2 [Cimex lectularius]|uniref:Adenylate kinase isoenzyme 5 n=1 Tax=Cimex lectularius TaxID=79782 RepID=A0A8I6S0T4_CIMLE|nr:adenylate kinase isoenzyme 5 isoform X2 [Cimex lectularius]
MEERNSPISAIKTVASELWYYLGQRDQNDSDEFEESGGRDRWLSGNTANYRFTRTPPEGQFPSQNGGTVKFEAPKVPVLFVLGGPGSGKVTHCDNLMQEKRGITHINMTDLLQQYSIDPGTIGSEMKDFSQLSSKTVTEVLMLEMKMSPAAKTFLISGYPRNMRDVVEYSNKIQIVNGVVLIAWRQRVLERQIDYGAKLGHVVLSLAKMELNNFYKNVMPVADYFDQRGMVIAVNGERNPAEVYADFRTAVMRIVGSQDGRKTANGAAPNGNITARPPTTVASVYLPPTKGYPPVIWVVGGPGSNKWSLCQKVVRRANGWVHLSVGRLLRVASEPTDPRQAADSGMIMQHIASGHLVPQAVALQLVESQMTTNMNAQGIIMDGYPRNMEQVKHFEEKYKQQPKVVLLDCSKLQLGRGRVDDSVSAFRKRLEVFREQTLPMLKTLDEEGRLQIVDGDSDLPEVQDEFGSIILGEVDRLRKANGLIVPETVANGDYENLLQDLESEDEGISTISKTVAAYNNINQGRDRPSRDAIRDIFS